MILGDWLFFSTVYLVWQGGVVLEMDDKYTTYIIMAQTHPNKRCLKPFIIIDCLIVSLSWSSILKIFPDNPNCSFYPSLVTPWVEIKTIYVEKDS